MTKQQSITALARQEIQTMVPYQSARRLEKGGSEFNSKIWLNANEASGPGIYQINGDCINRYPDFQPENLLTAYSNYADIAPTQILATRGADEGIELIIRTFCTAYQDNILICPPTYGMYAISAENHGAGIIKVEQQNNELDVDGVIQALANAKVVFLCSPGNPTGNLLPKAQIKAVLEASNNQNIIVVDEAYIEFSAQDSVQAWLAQYPNLVILRTLSKAFGLAGLRCGFTLASQEIIGLLSKVIAPYPVPMPVAELASKALASEQVLQMLIRVKETNILKNELENWLEQQVWCQQVFKSDANFVLFKTAFAAALFAELRQHGLLIRDQSKQVQLENCLRISIGSQREIDIFKQITEQFFQTQQQEVC